MVYRKVYILPLLNVNYTIRHGRFKIPLIKNINYKKFLTEGSINLVNRNHILEALKNIPLKNRSEGRALLIALYYTGARPVEIINLRSKHITTDGYYIIVFIEKTFKKGLPRKIYLRGTDKLIKELYNYAKTLPDEALLFFHYRNNYQRKNGRYSCNTDRIRYHLGKWFTGVIPGSISPYFLRHSRFSQLAEAGSTLQEIKYLKGARTLKSCEPYVHLSTAAARKLAKKIK